MISLHTIWFSLIFYWISFALAITSPSNGSNDTLSFPYPYVKPDPYPVLLQGPAGELFNFTKIGYSTGCLFTTAYVTVPAKAGPAPHIHHLTDEWFYFPEGVIEVFSSVQQYPDPGRIPNGIQLPKANMRRYITKPGDLVYAPAFYVHGFRNDDNVSRPMIFVWTPDRISQYFFEVGQIVTDPYKLPPVNDINKRLFVSQAPKYGINQSAYWDEYVASWNDGWQPLLGMDAHGQELLNLLGNTTAQYVPCPALVSHASLLHRSFVFIYPFGFIIIYMLSTFS